MSIKETLWEMLEEGSDAFNSLKAIEKWDMSTVWDNVNVIIEAVKDGFSMIYVIKDMATNIVNDDEAQEDLAQVLDEVIKLNAMLEAVDGLIFKIIIKTVCTAIKPFLGGEKDVADA